MKQVLIATNNKGKIAEFKEILKGTGLQVLSLGELGKNIPEPEETGRTFEDNALLKAQYYSQESGLPSVADDSGLVVDALNGRPGVYSARYIPGTDADRNHKVLREMEGKTDRRARFVSVIAYIDPDEYQQNAFTGTCEGTIATESRGTEGFGYDPIFIPDGYEQTMAELGSDVKNTLSHRKKALDLFVQWYKKQ